MRWAPTAWREAEFLTPIARDVFRAGQALGEAPRRAMVAGPRAWRLAAPQVAEVELPWSATPADVLTQLREADRARSASAAPPRPPT